jgi:hypothetical protein
VHWNQADQQTRIEESTIIMNTASASAKNRESRPRRRLKPEVAARLAARRRATSLEVLYERPAQELSPEEIAQLKIAFFQG